MCEAQDLTRALGGEWRGTSGLAPCPCCQPEGRRDQRALAVAEKGGKLLIKCHKSGCDAFAELRRRGLLGSRGDHPREDPAAAAKRKAEDAQREARRRKTALDLFAAGVAIAGTPAERYLTEVRGLAGLRLNKLMPCLRFHPACHHGASGKTMPAMLALIRGPDGLPQGVHRTWLQPDGSGKTTESPAKAMLGPASGGAVRFGPDRPVIALAEGLETALSVGLASRLTVWACLSTSGMKGLLLPPLPVASVVVIAADNDAAGLEAARVTAARLEAEGRAVSVVHPQREGADFNDLLREGAR